jgi:hypothetical protein
MSDTNYSDLVSELARKLAQIAADRVVTPMCPSINKEEAARISAHFSRVLREAGLERALEVLQNVAESSEMKSYDAGLVICASHKEEAAAALAAFREAVKR